MLISEIFHSIQGEGVLTGMPSVFVRTSGCNLRCAWCDTPYASWKPEGEDLSPGEILEKISTFSCRHVVLTGGEPMVARGIHDLALQLALSGHHVTIESAGTVPPDAITCHLASISPKLANSRPDAKTAGTTWFRHHDDRRLNRAALSEWVDSYDCQLKFVVSSRADLDEIEDLIAPLLAGRLGAERVLLMPEGVDVGAMNRVARWLVGECLRRGYRFCDRLQIRLFGNSRGT